jgi:uncharacterized protein YciI
LLFIIYQEDVENSAPLREIHKPAHFKYLTEWEDKLVLGGAMMSDDGTGRLGSVLILNVKSRIEAEAFSANEPLRMGGVFKSVKITRMRRGQWNPNAAPKTAEGN